MHSRMRRRAPTFSSTGRSSGGVARPGGRRVRSRPQYRVGPRPRRPGSQGVRHDKDLPGIRARRTAAVGVRNRVAVISIMDNCNPVTRSICHAVDGTLAVTTLIRARTVRPRSRDRVQHARRHGAQSEHRGGPAGGARGRQTSEEVARRIRPSGKPVESINLQPDGTINCCGRGHAAGNEARHRARRAPRPYVLPGVRIARRCRVRWIGYYLRAYLQSDHRTTWRTGWSTTAAR